jgi:hypothetical protein
MSDPRELAARIMESQARERERVQSIATSLEAGSLEMALQFHQLIWQALQRCVEVEEEKVKLNLELNAGKDLLLLCQAYNAVATGDAQRRMSYEAAARKSTQPPPNG